VGYRVRTVLLVDDDYELGELLVLLLGELGYRVVVAADVHSLKRLASRYEVDVALVNLMLPERGGFIACHIIKDLIGSHVALVLMAPVVEVVGDPEVQGLGVVDWLIMPYDIEAVVDRVERAFSAVRRAHAEPPGDEDVQEKVGA
jgi:DNA-binding response OmpR family regulator